MTFSFCVLPGSRVISAGVALTDFTLLPTYTVTYAERAVLLIFALMVVLPSFMPFTLPESVTVATERSVVVQLRRGPRRPVMTGFKVMVFPTGTVTALYENLMDAASAAAARAGKAPHIPSSMSRDIMRADALLVMVIV